MRNLLLTDAKVQYSRGVKSNGLSCHGLRGLSVEAFVACPVNLGPDGRWP